ncbi:hypothetical protein Tco_0887578 [Tanacetum coccineum]
MVCHVGKVYEVSGDKGSIDTQRCEGASNQLGRVIWVVHERHAAVGPRMHMAGSGLAVAVGLALATTAGTGPSTVGPNRKQDQGPHSRQEE